MQTDMSTEDTLRVDQVRTGRVNYFMHLINAIGTFNGTARQLEPFIARMDAVKMQMDANPMDELTNVNLHYLFVARVEDLSSLKRTYASECRGTR